MRAAQHILRHFPVIYFNIILEWTTYWLPRNLFVTENRVNLCKDKLLTGYVGIALHS